MDMRTRNTPSPARVLRTLNRVLKSQVDSLDQIDSERAKQAHAQQAQFIRGLRT